MPTSDCIAELRGLRVIPLGALTTPPVRRRSQSEAKAPCMLCGQGLRQWTKAVHIINGGSFLLSKNSEPTYVPDAGDMGLLPVGPDCARRIPKEFLHETR